eukprot:jgi/Galph1/3826/GphlegSOOS_G2488.1
MGSKQYTFISCLCIVLIFVIWCSVAEAHRSKVKAKSDIFERGSSLLHDSYKVERGYLKGKERKLQGNRFGKSLEQLKENWNAGAEAERLENKVQSEVEDRSASNLRLLKMKDHKMVVAWNAPHISEKAEVKGNVKDGVLRVVVDNLVVLEERLDLSESFSGEAASVSTYRNGDDVVFKIYSPFHRKSYNHHMKHFLEHLGDEGRTAFNVCREMYGKDMAGICGCICEQLTPENVSVSCYDHLINISAIYAEKFGFANASAYLKEALGSCQSLVSVEQHMNCSSALFNKIVDAYEVLKSSKKCKRYMKEGFPEKLKEQVSRVLIA